MDRQSRREAVRDYKERKVLPGIFAIRCAASGEAWVGVSRNLGQQQNGLWFGLRQGAYPNRVLQAAWTRHGEPAFAFEVLEPVTDDTLSAYELDNRLKDRHRHWLAELGATRVVG